MIFLNLRSLTTEKRKRRTHGLDSEVPSEENGVVPARVTLMKILLQASVENVPSVASLCAGSALTYCCGGFGDIKYPVTVTFVEPRLKHFDFVELRAKHFTLLDALNSQAPLSIALPAPAHCRKGPSTVIT